MLKPAKQSFVHRKPRFPTVCMISPVISEYDKDLKSKHAGQRVADVPILGVPQNHPSKIIQTVAKIEIMLTVCMILRSIFSGNGARATIVS